MVTRVNIFRCESQHECSLITRSCTENVVVSTRIVQCAVSIQGIWAAVYNVSNKDGSKFSLDMSLRHF